MNAYILEENGKGAESKDFNIGSHITGYDTIDGILTDSLYFFSRRK